MGTGNWTQLPDLNRGRRNHACSHVWVDDGGEISADDKGIFATIVVAGGNLKDVGESSVEILSIFNKWIVLTRLPKIQDKYMNHPFGLLWMPYLGLRLLGGCNDDACTNQVWQLSYNSTYHWAEK